MPSTPIAPEEAGASHRRPFTVLQVIPSLETGGAERAVIDIAAALVRRGDRALVASEGGRLEAELADAGGRLVRLPTASKNPARIGLLAHRLIRLIRAENVDIVHARSRAPAWAARLASRRTGIPFVTTFHGIYSERNAMKRRYNSVMARGDIVIANSHYTAELIKERYGTPAGPIVVIRRGIDGAAFSFAAVGEARRQSLRRAWGLGGGEAVVLNLARLTEWKGQRVLVEAASMPPLSEHEGLVVVLAGDTQGRDKYRAALEDLIARHDLKGRVRIVGHCDDAPAALSLAGVAVVASTEPEAFGRTAIEAAAMGIPVVATGIGATAETVLAPPLHSSEQRTGWLVPSNDAAGIGEAIEAALRLSPSERAALAERARRHAMRFTTESMQEATLAAYDRLLLSRREGSRS
jgi:glycosyltransferase involved in cell wall biosynthesis